MDRPIAWEWERERRPDGSVGPCLVVFLAGAECPFGCVYCDLWRYTLDGPTPAGALPRQLEVALSEAGPVPPGAWIKLYNASNFFDERAVPLADEPALVELVRPFATTVVECHPRLVGKRCTEFAERLGGRLQVAMGLETVHPKAMPRLGKSMTLDDYTAACGRLLDAGIGVRAFVLVGAPYVAGSEMVGWAELTAAFAFEHGAEQVSLIPLRRGARALDRLAAEGEVSWPMLDDLEVALDRCLSLGGVVSVDLWDVQRLTECPHCFAERRARLGRINLSGQAEPVVVCPAGCRPGPEAG